MRLRHADDIVSRQIFVEHDFALGPGPKDVYVWFMTMLISRVHDNTEAFDLNSRHNLV